MKKWVTALCLSLFVSSAYAQGFDFAIRAGVNFPGMSVDEFAANSNFQELKAPDRQFGFHAGFSANIDLLMLFIEPQIIYTNLNHELIAVDFNGMEETITLDNSRIDVPLLIGKKLGPVRLFAGPVYSVNLGDEQADYESGTFGYQAGLGLELSKFMLDVKYEGAFSQTAGQVIVDNSEYATDLRANQIVVSLGFKLF